MIAALRARDERVFAELMRMYNASLLRVALIVWPIAAVAIGVGAVAAAIPLAGTRVPALAVAGAIAVIACGTLAASMLADLARIHVARTGVRRAGAAVLAALRIVVGQLARLLVLALVFGIALALAMVALLAVRGWLSGETWPSILAGIAVQQAHAFARTWLRASLVASEVVLAEADAEVRAAKAAALAEAAAVAAAAAAEAEAASVAPHEERPEVLVVVQGEAGEGRLAGDERPGGADLAPEIARRLPAEGDGGRGDRDPEEAGPALPTVAGNRPRDEPPPVA